MEQLLTREELIAQGYPFGYTTKDIPFGDPKTEWMRTGPDAVIYVPKEDLGPDCDNETLVVTPTSDGSELLAIWTQSSVECNGDNRIMLSRSSDGINWSNPEVITGATKAGEKQSSWAVPMYTKSGRLYICFMQETDHGEPVLHRCESGEMGMMYSDDNGHTWSEKGFVSLPRNRHNHPDPQIDPAWWIFQAPIRDAEDRFVLGYTIIKSPALQKVKLNDPHAETRQAFLRFENLDENPEPEDVRVTIEPSDGLEVYDPDYPGNTVAQEGAPVLLPDGRLFATMRTMTGYIYYTVREKDGWRTPEPMIGWDGKPVPHPLSPCPIYRLEDGTYLCVTNNNSGIRDDFEKKDDSITIADLYWKNRTLHRNPLYWIAGVYDPEGKQPIRFGKPMKFLDTGDVALGQRKGELSTPGYAALTQWKGKTMFWYPDRKFNLLGKEITGEFLERLKADF